MQRLHSDWCCDHWGGGREGAVDVYVHVRSLLIVVCAGPLASFQFSLAKLSVVSVLEHVCLSTWTSVLVCLSEGAWCFLIRIFREK